MADGGDGTVIPFPQPDLIEDGIYETPPKQSEDQAVIQAAYDLITDDRQEQHGAPEVCHGEIAKLWTWWVGVQVDAHDVAIMMDLLKTARIKTGAYNRDCYIDKVGYTALAARLRKSPKWPTNP